MTAVKKRAHQLVRGLGFDVVRYPPRTSRPELPATPPAQPADRPSTASLTYTEQWSDLAGILRRLSINHVIDVGANMGQYAKELRGLGYQGPIDSYEPVIAAYNLAARDAATDDLWTVTNCAIGAVEGEVTINVAANKSQSSSILPMLARHEEAAPHAKYIGEQTVAVRTLDEVTGQVAAGTTAFLKVDTQGFEREVLAGAGALLAGPVAAIQIELSMVPLYAGGPLYPEIFDALHAAGFRLTHVIAGYVDPATGEMLQFDGIFVRDIEGTITTAT